MVADDDGAGGEHAGAGGVLLGGKLDGAGCCAVGGPELEMAGAVIREENGAITERGDAEGEADIGSVGEMGEGACAGRGAVGGPELGAAGGVGAGEQGALAEGDDVVRRKGGVGGGDGGELDGGPRRAAGDPELAGGGENEAGHGRGDAGAAIGGGEVLGDEAGAFRRAVAGDQAAGDGEVGDTAAHGGLRIGDGGANTGDGHQLIGAGIAAVGGPDPGLPVGVGAGEKDVRAEGGEGLGVEPVGEAVGGKEFGRARRGAVGGPEGGLAVSIDAAKRGANQAAVGGVGGDELGVKAEPLILDMGQFGRAKDGAVGGPELDGAGGVEGAEQKVKVVRHDWAGVCRVKMSGRFMGARCQGRSLLLTPWPRSTEKAAPSNRRFPATGDAPGGRVRRPR